MKASISRFLTALEFLTRIHFTHRTEWEAGEFGRSVVFFPVAGCIIGLLMQLTFLLLLKLELPLLLQAVLLVLAEIFFTGSLLYDGFMDTCDGIFSARSRQRMLEIMKDSHVGSNAVLGLLMLILLKVSLFQTFPAELLFLILPVTYIASRSILVVYIVHFPNARPGGLGALFKEGTNAAVTAAALCIGLILIVLIKPVLLLPVCLSFFVSLITAKYLTNLLGGLTGDTFGFLTETGEVGFLFVALVLWKLHFIF